MIRIKSLDGNQQHDIIVYKSDFPNVYDNLIKMETYTGEFTTTIGVGDSEIPQLIEALAELAGFKKPELVEKA